MANTTGVADHKATGPAIPGLTVERTKAIILLIVQLFSVAQTGLSIAGISQLPFTTDQVSTAITGVIAVIASVYAWWRNNNLTGAAVQAADYITFYKEFPWSRVKLEYFKDKMLQADFRDRLQCDPSLFLF